MLRRTYELDMVPGGIPLSIHLSQYDSDVQLIFQLYASQGALAIPDTGVRRQLSRIRVMIRCPVSRPLRSRCVS